MPRELFIQQIPHMKTKYVYTPIGLYLCMYTNRYDSKQVQVMRNGFPGLVGNNAGINRDIRFEMAKQHALRHVGILSRRHLGCKIVACLLLVRCEYGYFGTYIGTNPTPQP